MGSDDVDVIVFSDSDLKKDGKFKVKNNSVIFTGREFKKYVKVNHLKLSKGYIDLIGYLSDGRKFKCKYNGMVIGVTGIIEDIDNDR